MPGVIRVSVLEAVDLPEVLTDGTFRKDVTAKVILGPRLYKTEPGIADGGRIDSWNSDFSFPVMNLRDKLVVAICNNEDQSVTQTAIDIPSIIEKGSRDEFVKLAGGGRIHLRMSFVLTDEERKKIEIMRLSTLKRRQEERLKRTVVFQTVQPTYDDELRKSPVSTVTITDIDGPMTDERKAPKDSSKGPVGFGTTTKPLAPIVMFDYARAVGSQSCRSFRKTERRSNNLSNGGKANNGDVNLGVQNVRGSAMDAGEVVPSECTGLDASVASPRSIERAALSMKRSVRSASTASQSPISQSSTSGRNTFDTANPQVVVPACNYLEWRGDFTESTIEHQKVKWSNGNPRGRNMLDTGAAALATSHFEECIFVEGQTEKRILNRSSTPSPYPEQLQISDGHQTIRPLIIKVESPRIEFQSGQGQRFEVRSRPGARWAHKTGLETRWTSPKKARRIIREEWNGRVSDPLKAKAKIFEIIKAAGCSHKSYGHFRSCQEHHSLADSFGTVLNKVVGGAAMLLAALFMMWPLVEGSPHGGSIKIPLSRMFFIRFCKTLTSYPSGYAVYLAIRVHVAVQQRRWIKWR